MSCSNLGRVRSWWTRLSGKGTRNARCVIGPTARILKYDSSAAYLRVYLTRTDRRKRYSVHRLVAEAFLVNTGNCPQVNHRNCIKRDNRLYNLEWMTPLENMRYARLMGAFDHADKKFSQNTMSDKTHFWPEEIRAIRLRYAYGESLASLAGWFNTTSGYVSVIVNRKCWKLI